MSSIQITVLIWLTSFYGVQSAMNATRMTTILNELLTGYEKHIPPVEKDGPVNVSVQLVISDMFPYNSVDMHYSTDFYLKMVWYDYRLAYNKTDHSSMIPLRGKKLWKPDIYFPMAKKGSLHSVPEVNEGSSLFLNGTVSHSQRINLMSYCAMELTYYPFDIQKCSFELTTFVNSKKFVSLNWDKFPVIEEKGKLVMKDFNIIKHNVTKRTSSSGREGVFDCLIINFRFYRYLAFYFLRDFFPCILIVLLSWITFWIDYSSTPARVGMGITTVLTIVTMTNNIRNGSPPAGLFRSLDWYLLMCNLFVFAALAEYAIVGLTSGTRKKQPKNKNDCHDGKFNGISSGLGNINIMMTDFGTPERKKDVESSIPEVKKAKRNCHYIDRISRFFFPGTFVTLNIIYFVYHRLNKNTVD